MKTHMTLGLDLGSSWLLGLGWGPWSHKGKACLCCELGGELLGWLWAVSVLDQGFLVPLSSSLRALFPELNLA